MVVCAQCSKSINPGRPWGRFCSSRCRKQAWVKCKRLVPKIQLKCEDYDFIRELYKAINEIKNGRVYIASAIVRNALVDFEANPDNVSTEEMMSFASNYK